MSCPLLDIRDLSRRFPGVLALDRVSLTIEKGSCHGLVGENGAGKSTLGRILAGIHAPDDGVIRLNGAPVRFRSPLDAMQRGIGLVHQELAFCPNLTVAENLLLGRLPRRGPWLDRAALHREARACLEQIGADIDVDQPMERLSVAQEQLVQIAAAARVGALVLVLDEPTSALSDRETRRLFALMRELQSRGVTLIYVSHRLGEVFELCDAISVLRDGRHVVTLPAAQTTPDELVRHMIGRPLEQYLPAHAAAPRGPIVMSVRNLSSPGRFADISFDLHSGEILGLAGLVGAGRSEIAHALFGLDRNAAGTICFPPLPRGGAFSPPMQWGGATFPPCTQGGFFPATSPTTSNVREPLPRTPRDALAHGIGFLPEDRKRQGLILQMGLRANLSLAILNRLLRLGFIRRTRERSLADEYVRRLSIRAAHIDAAVAGLSGGNQQKVALAKWLAAQCPILIVDEPTRGVDVGAKAEIHALLDQLAAAGTAILLISSELPELLALSTRVLVVREGRLVGELPRADATQERVLRLMAGVDEPLQLGDSVRNKER